MTTIRSVLLVVEDEPDFRKLIRLSLEDDPRIQSSGEATTARAAIEVARKSHPDLVILDNYLEGDLNGLEAAPLLKAAAPESKILLFTAYDLSAQARREPAIDAFLRKDDIKKLLPVAQRLLGLDPQEA
ncbi:MAG: response regulator [Actinomycetota bacterium]